MALWAECRRDIDPQLALARGLKGPRREHGPGSSLPALPPPGTSRGASPSLEAPLAAFLGAQYAPLNGTFYGDSPKHAGKARGGGACPQKDPSGAGGGPTPAKPPGYQTPGPAAYTGDPLPPTHPGAVAGGATAQPGPGQSTFCVKTWVLSRYCALGPFAQGG